MLAIHSAYSDRSITLRDAVSDYFVAELRGDDILAVLRVYAWNSGESIGQFFARVCEERMPWGTTHKWVSVEGEFIISASCSNLGQVCFRVEMSCRTENAAWDVNAEVVTELGQLPRIGADAAAFCSDL